MALSPYQKFAYSVGHVLNDICASMWFSYLLIFFTEILQFSNIMAGNLLLVGQIADGVVTPFVGYESDKSPFTCTYGRRKTWHLVGTVCVTLTFPLLFLQCLDCDLSTPEYVKFIYYAPLVVIFQFGWASTQINHLALIPDLTHNDGDKVTLNSLRYGFTVISSILVYSVAWLMLGMPGSSSSDADGKLSPSDAPMFRNLVLSVVGVGVVFSAIFHFVLKEKKTRTSTCYDEAVVNGDVQDKGELDRASERSPLLGNGTTDRERCVDSSESESTSLIKSPSCTPIAHWYDWFKRPAFYQMAILYMCTRLIVNLSQVYMPKYLTDSLLLHKNFIAIVPLVTYLSSFVSAMLSKPLSLCIKQELIYAGGAVCVLSACVWAHFLKAGSMQIFGMAVTLGFGTSIILVMSLSMTTRLIGTDTASGAFVFGAMSLTDKISNGVAIEVVQYLNPCKCQCADCAEYFRIVMSYLIGAITIFALLTLTITVCMKRFHRHRSSSDGSLVVAS